MIALNETQKPAIWCPGLTPNRDITRGLRGYWPLWEGVGERVTNLAAPVGDGAFADQYNGYPKWEQSTLGHVVRTPSYNSSLWYDKARINFGSSSWLSPTEAITVVLRIRLPGPYYPGLFDNPFPWFARENTATSAWGITINGNAYRFSVTLAGTRREISAPFSDWNNWQFLAGTYDGRSMRLYQNGNLIAGPAAYTGPIGQGLASPAYYGPLLDFGYTNLDVQISELALWDRALSPGEIQWLYRNPFGLCRLPVWEACDTRASVLGPYHIAVGNVWRGGAEAGGQYLTGASAGIAMVDGQQAGRIHG